MTTLASTAPPRAPPTVRMLAFMPLATPVWDCGTASTTRFDIAAKASPNASPSRVVSATTCQSWSWSSTSPRVPSEVSVAPTTSSTLEPKRAASRPEARPARKVAAVCGSSSSPETVTDAPKP